MTEKFSLTMRVKVDDLEQLRRHFDAESTLEYFRAGRLVEWLRALGCNGEASAVSAIDRNDPEAIEKIRAALKIDASENTFKARTTISNLTGMHARVAGIFAQKAGDFKSSITVKANGKTVDGKSTMALLSMGIIYGTELSIVAEGSDAERAVKELKSLIDSGFGEESYD